MMNSCKPSLILQDSQNIPPVKNKKVKYFSGFTIVELMIAAVVFGVLMMIATSAVVLMSRQFHKGLITARTQEVTRSIVEDISRNVQYSASEPVIQPGSICVSQKEYLYSIGGPSVRRHIGCGVAGSSDELLGRNMRISNLRLEPMGQRVYRLTVKVAYGDDDLLHDHDNENARCKGGAGHEFCSVSEISVTLVKRL